MSFRDKCSHYENRKKICAPCGEKIVFGKNKPEKYLITDKIENLINKYVSKKCKITNEKYPLSICRTCYLTLLDMEKEICTRPLQKMPNYEDIILPRDTRATLKEGTCSCYICEKARFKGHIKCSTGKGKKRNVNNIINTSSGPGETLQNEKFSNSLSLKKKPAETMKLCDKCFQEVGKGKKHSCKNSAENMMKIIELLPEKEKEKIAANIIKNKVDCDEAGPSKKIINQTLVLTNSKGRKSRIIVNPSETEKIVLTEENLDNFRVNLGASTNQMRKITNFFRSNVGRMSIPPDYLKHMSKKSKIFNDVYKAEIQEFDCEKIPLKQKRPVVYANAEEVLETVIEHRKIIGNVLIKVMADGGQKFFKISLSILPENYDPDSDSLNNDKYLMTETENTDSSLEVFEEHKSHKRTLYSEGGILSKKAKLTSVNRLILLCVVPQIKESYDNMKLLFDLTKVNNIPFKFVSDFKMLLIINGQQTASASFPCPYCFISLKELKNDPYSENDVNVKDDTSSNHSRGMEDSTRLKTYGDLRADYEKYCLAGQTKGSSKNCHSTVNPPLLNEDDNVFVLQKCIIPELHVLQGFVNHLFWRGLVPLLGREKAILWPTKLNLIPKNYHGEAFEGNACRNLLKSADNLNNPEIYSHVGYLKIAPYIAAFKAMNKIVVYCFTSRKVAAGGGPCYGRVNLVARTIV